MFQSRPVKPMQDILDGLEKAEPRARMGIWLKSRPSQTQTVLGSTGWVTYNSASTNSIIANAFEIT